MGTMTDSEYNELMALLDKLIVQEEDAGHRAEAEHLAEAYRLVHDCQNLGDRG